MARKIYCQKCGVIRPTPQEDAARGLFQRYVRGSAIRSMVCDLCGIEITVGDHCIAWSQPANMLSWEQEYVAEGKNDGTAC